ncbi:hypothetical protein [Agrobacterium bohemicum]|uniref:DUF4123 domain-containing protein n=1 Tax=Agrobacterium bohemicum TaxID=2052828 RepID=A0A135P102_9HYPH|nr:hypothetical protein [Agrobacterium bohemicum]KXG85088.1 hypothetical protein ATO67_10755 [Agrobacterium bohemicum]
MTPDAVDETQLSSVAQALLKSVSELVSDPDQRVYVVMDGSQFDDLPKLFKAANVFHRPLYRYAGGDYAIIVGGPWLIDPYQAALPATTDQRMVDEGADDISDEELEAHSAALSAQMVASLEAGDPTGGGMLPVDAGHAPALVIERLRHVVKLTDGKPAAVFWSGASSLSSEHLYKHLRGLNRISVPKVWKDNQPTHEGPRVRNEEEFTAAGEDAPLEDLTNGGQEMVIFRHADANVMMQTIPALDEVQLARLFGPATQLIFAPDLVWGGGVKRARHAANIKPPLGALQFDPAAMQVMSAARLEVSRQRVMAYLREADPENNKLSDADLRKKTLFYELDGKEMGLRSEGAHARWAFLMSSTDGQIGQEQDIRKAVKTSADPDQTLAEIMDGMVRIGQSEIQGKRISGSS